MADFTVSFAQDSLRAEVRQDSNLRAEVDSMPVNVKMDVTNNAEFTADLPNDEEINFELGEVFRIQGIEGDYNALDNKPKINGVTVVGDKSLKDYGIVDNSDHKALRNRDALNQHPIRAITDLEPELAARPSEALTNMDIQRILDT